MANRNTKNKLKDASETLETAKEKISEAKDKTEEMITEKPFTSVAIAATAGALIALGVASWMKQRKSFLENVRDLF